MTKENEKMHFPKVTLDNFFTTQEERDAENLEKVQMIPVNKISNFPKHPYQVREDEEMDEFVKNIKDNGVILPVIVRPKEDGTYEMISGHRRKRACELAGIAEIKAIVRDMTDEEAIIQMVDSNKQREKILPSEKAFAYKMKLVAMSHQGRKGFTSAQLGRKCVGKESRELIAEQVGQSRNQISRYIRLTELIPEILEMVDNRKMALNPAVSISYLDKKQQKLLYKVMVALKATPSISQAKAIREKASESDFTEDYLVSILSEKKPN